MADTEAFLARLRAAFPQKPLDFSNALTGGIDEGEFRDAVAGKKWTELDPALVGRRSDVLCFLQPTYFVQVLPAFLRSLATDGAPMGVADTLLVVLDVDRDPRVKKNAELMTDVQRALVAEALESFGSITAGGQAAAAAHAIKSWRREG